MAEGKICVCPQCGKKFKLKAGFAAASFACTSCGATVWLDKKPAPSKKVPRTKRGGAATRARRGGKRAPAARKGRTRGGRREAAAEAEEQRPRGRYSSQGNNQTNVILAVVGLLIVVGGILFFVLRDTGAPADGNETQQASKESAETGAGEQSDPTMGAADTGAGSPAPSDTTDEGLPEVDPGGQDGTGEAGDGDASGAAKKADDGEKAADDGGEAEKKDNPLMKIGGSGKKRPKGDRGSRYYPPADLGHLDSTPPELRKQIDELIDTMFDVDAGIDSARAKQKLAAIGKPAFLPILGRMRRERDKLKDDSSLEERRMEASIKLADETLRMMDGHLDAQAKQPIRPGTDNRYIDYILKWHHYRWVKELSELNEMPGPFTPSYDDGGGEDG